MRHGLLEGTLARASGSVLDSFLFPPFWREGSAGLKCSFILLYPDREGEQGGTAGGREILARLVFSNPPGFCVSALTHSHPSELNSSPCFPAPWPVRMTAAVTASPPLEHSPLSLSELLFTEDVFTQEKPDTIWLPARRQFSG